jgi:hypothetical protein
LSWPVPWPPFCPPLWLPPLAAPPCWVEDTLACCAFTSFGAKMASTKALATRTASLFCIVWSNRSIAPYTLHLVGSAQEATAARQRRRPGMSALGQKRRLRHVRVRSALPPKETSDGHEFLGCSALKRSAPNLALPTAIGILVDLSLSFEPAPLDSSLPCGAFWQSCL